MNRKIIKICSLFLIFCLCSCTNLIEDRNDYESENEAAVSFSFGNGRSIASTPHIANYKYSLTGICNGDSTQLCENKSYTDFLNAVFYVQKGDWTFTITAYENNKPVYSDSKNVIISAQETSVSFVLRAVTGGYGSLSLKLNYPADKGVSKVTAKLYDSIPSSDEGTELTLNSDSSVTFVSDSVVSGKNQFLKFFLYNSQDVCIASWAESVFLINGDSLDLERTLSAVNSFATTVYLTVQNQPWINSGAELKAVKDGKEYTLQAGTNSNAYTASLPLGTYTIYYDNIDAGINLSVTPSETASATKNFDTPTRFATLENISDVISNLTCDATIIMSGILTNDDIYTIKNAIKQSNYKINLDLAETSGLTSLPENAFYGCKKLKGIEIPDSVTSIGYSAFEECTSLESVEIPNSVTSIGEYAFYGCTSLESIEIPNSVTSIGVFAFYKCTSLESIEIPNSVTSIGDNAFNGCTSLKSIEIPNSVTSIGVYAFYKCTSLESIEIPNSVTSIGEDAFEECTSLESVEIPNSVTCIVEAAFLGCTSLESIEIPNSVTSIGVAAFYGCTSLESIEIPNSVTSIGVWAFYGCTSLESIEIPNSVTSIGTEAFCECTKLHTINFFGTEEQWNAIDKGTYWNKNCPSAMVINFNCVKATVSNIADVISGLTSDATIIMSGNVTSDNLTTIKDAIRQSNYKINLDLSEASELTSLDYAFNQCHKLQGIEIPNSVTSIGQGAFWDCESLESIEIPNSVTSIDSNALHGCTSLKSIEIPNSVTSIGDNAFAACTSLESIEIPNSVTSIGRFAFTSCTSLKSIEIPNSVTSTGEGAFWYCTSLESVEIPDSVTSIDSSAFRECTSLESIEIPNSVTSIDRFAFSECTSLQTINYTGTEEQWNAISKVDNWNRNCPSDMVINYNYQGE